MAARSPSQNDIEAGRKLFAGPIEFRMGVAKVEQLPEAFAVEVAFGGRSNSGKSSLINALAGRRQLARASNRPGRTRELNYFIAGNGRLAIVDLPGYGHAEAGKSAVAAWQRLIRDYLQGRAGLRRVFILVDARHGLKPVDIETLKLLDEAAVSYQIVLTKADKCTRGDLDRVCSATRRAVAKRPAAHPELIVTSSKRGDGIADLRAEIASMVPDAQQ
ncbi:MAG TPA: ribosome biogenesis GTP-binding protein YihA/YsxC [Aestuariivirgaceae bacterium]|jgi:GTP-binding protein